MTVILSWLLTAVVLQMPMTLRSSAFTNNGPLPVAYTAYGDFKSPPLAWSHAPKGTREFVLTVENSDAPLERFSTHWLLYGIPAGVNSLPETPRGAARDREAPIKGARQGTNAMKGRGYLPPRPFANSGAQHFTFTLSAVDVTLALPDGATKEQVLAAIKGHVLAQATLVAVFERKE